jgi:hypothetical protein
MAPKLPINTAGSKTATVPRRASGWSRKCPTRVPCSILCPAARSFTKRLTELLSIGNIGQPQLAGKHYFYTRRDGMQNQPVLYVREGLDGKDRVLVDANQLAADGTVALDWYQPSENGKYVAYGTSLADRR